MLASIPSTRHSGEALAALSQRCPYCCDTIPREAKKCRTCGEWVVGTSGGFSAAVLRLLGLAWAALTLAAGAGLWTLAQGVRRWVWLHSVDTAITPQLAELAMYVAIAVFVMRGLMVSVGVGVIAGMSPRRPRWWS
jgi:hypothetical protein